MPGISVAVDGNGQAYAAYTEGSGPGHAYALLLKSSSDAGRTWSASRHVSTAPRPQSNDAADHKDVLITAHGNDRVCVVCVDDDYRTGNVWFNSVR